MSGASVGGHAQDTHPASASADRARGFLLRRAPKAAISAPGSCVALKRTRRVALPSRGFGVVSGHGKASRVVSRLSGAVEPLPPEVPPPFAIPTDAATRTAAERPYAYVHAFTAALAIDRHSRAARGLSFIVAINAAWMATKASSLAVVWFVFIDSFSLPLRRRRHRSPGRTPAETAPAASLWHRATPRPVAP